MCLRQIITLDFYGMLSMPGLFLKIGKKKPLLSAVITWQHPDQVQPSTLKAGMVSVYPSLILC